MSGFKWRYASADDYECVLKRWWNEWGFPVPPKECLPERGVVVSDGEGDLYGGFLYVTDGGVGWMEWVVSNRSAATERRRGALDFLCGVVCDLAKREGMSMVFTSTNLPGYRNGLERCGFKRGDEGMCQLIRKVV